MMQMEQQTNNQHDAGGTTKTNNQHDVGGTTRK